MKNRRRSLTEEMVFMRTKCNRLDLIRNLNLWGNDLHNISVLKHMPNLEVLSLSVNSVSTLADLRNLSKLSELYLRKNNIRDLEEVTHLANLRQLRVLWLSDNPCATLPHYRLYVLSLLPNLLKLDSQDVTEDERRQAQRSDLSSVQTRIDADMEDDDDGDLGDDRASEMATPMNASGRRGGATPTNTSGVAAANNGPGDGGRIDRFSAEQQYAFGRRYSAGDVPRYPPGTEEEVYEARRNATRAMREDRGPDRSMQHYDSPMQPAMSSANERTLERSPVGGGFENPSPDMTPRSDIYAANMERDYGHGGAADHVNAYAHMGAQHYGAEDRGGGGCGGGGWPDARPSRPYSAWNQESPPRHSAGFDRDRRHAPYERPQAERPLDVSRQGSREPSSMIGPGESLLNESLYSAAPVDRAPAPAARGDPGAGDFGRSMDDRAARGDNILCAVLALIKELDRQGLELVRRAVEQRQDEL
eukprot:TRINITY_DN13255_c0_g1_i1.p1 TRINITY_DN13255_c0_g1~~TRINITY_DN13255_c0_g1_i1.p1  ORF type:complete len:475 (+),score=68.17 TRINITY_DN13255_c0_g1_i1:113-1537(+)